MVLILQSHLAKVISVSPILKNIDKIMERVRLKCKNGFDYTGAKGTEALPKKQLEITYIRRLDTKRSLMYRNKIDPYLKW